jgi:ribosome-associated protein
MSQPWNEDEEPLGKSERKRRSEDLQKLGEQLITLPATELDNLPLDEKLRDAVDAARGMNKRGALLRQRQYIGRLMRDVDAEPIRQALALRQVTDRRHVRLEHEVESWRERLLDDEPEAWSELATLLEAADLRNLRSLARQARAERSAARPPAASRQLFRRLRDALTGGQGRN